MATAKKKAASTASASSVAAAKQEFKQKKKAANRAAYRIHQAQLREELQAEIDAPRPMGRPVYPYTDELGQQIFDLIVEGKSIMKISRLPDMPSDVTMFKWIGDDTHKFSSLYARAKQLVVARMEEEITDLADDAERGKIITETFKVVDGELEPVTEVRYADNVERTKLRIMARQWQLAHLRPKKHGRRAEDEGGGKNEQLEALFNSLKQGPAQ
jgi:hypothetical protein